MQSNFNNFITFYNFFTIFNDFLIIDKIQDGCCTHHTNVKMNYVYIKPGQKTFTQHIYQFHILAIGTIPAQNQTFWATKRPSVRFLGQFRQFS